MISRSERRKKLKHIEIAKRLGVMLLLLISIVAGVFSLKVLLHGVAVSELTRMGYSSQELVAQRIFEEKEKQRLEKIRKIRNGEIAVEMVVTGYCSCVKCCGKDNGITATGTKATQGRTIAVDPRVIPLKSRVLIDNVQYVAEDVGGAIKGNRIDLYFDSHQDALKWGVRSKKVRVVR